MSTKENDLKLIEFMKWVQQTYHCHEHPNQPIEIYKLDPKGRDLWIVGCTAPVSEEALKKGHFREGYNGVKRCFHHDHIDPEETGLVGYLVLDGADSKAFLQALDNPPEPTEHAKAAAARYASIVRMAQADEADGTYDKFVSPEDEEKS